MLSKQLADRLKKAREAAGLSIADAAAKLGFASYQTLSKVEAGEREVKAAELSLFAKAYFTTITFLLGEAESPRTAPALLWRNPPSGEKKKEIEAQIFYICGHYQLLEKLLGINKNKEFRFLDIAKDDIRTNADINILAEKTSALLSLGNRPAYMLQRALEQEYDIKILFRSLAGVGSAASTVSAEFGAAVVINTDEAPWRRNYDLAHELFHLITWKIVPVEDLQDKTFFGDIEKKADRFASTLLLPEKEVKEELNKRIKSQKTLTLSDLVDIAREFGVSTSALLFRLVNLSLIKWEVAEELRKDEELLGLDKHKRKKDWGDKPISENLYSLAVRCLRKGLVSRGKFAEIVEIDRSDIDGFLSKFGLMEKEGATVEIMAT